MSEFTYFKKSDFDCQESGENRMQDHFIHQLDDLRQRCGWPFIITSGYRDPSHSVERHKKNGGGTHTQGIAADIRVQNGQQRHELVKHAMDMGFSGIGIAKTFVHVDQRKDIPVLWNY